jgi:hypothetical protein
MTCLSLLVIFRYWQAQMCLQAGAEQVMILDNPLQSAELCLRRAGVAEVLKTAGNILSERLGVTTH